MSGDNRHCTSEPTAASILDWCLSPGILLVEMPDQRRSMFPREPLHLFWLSSTLAHLPPNWSLWPRCRILHTHSSSLAPRPVACSQQSADEQLCFLNICFSIFLCSTITLCKWPLHATEIFVSIYIIFDAFYKPDQSLNLRLCHPCNIRCDTNHEVPRFTFLSIPLLLSAPLPIPLSILFSNTFSLCSSLNVRDQVPNP
jgi:hypothetical protein